MAYVPPAERGSAYARHVLWEDLRPSEAERPTELIAAVYAECEPTIDLMLVEATVRVGPAFAAAFPKAPRPELER